MANFCLGFERRKASWVWISTAWRMSLFSTWRIRCQDDDQSLFLAIISTWTENSLQGRVRVRVLVGFRLHVEVVDVCIRLSLSILHNGRFIDIRLVWTIEENTYLYPLRCFFFKKKEKRIRGWNCALDENDFPCNPFPFIDFLVVTESIFVLGSKNYPS